MSNGFSKTVKVQGVPVQTSYAEQEVNRQYAAAAAKEGDVFDRYLEARATISAAQIELRFCKRALVKKAIDAGVADQVLSVNINRLRRILGR